MDLIFELGEAASPRGHALVYFRASDGRIFATYVIVPPVPIEFGKFLPPMFASQLPALGLSQAAVPLPPMLEEVESQAWLERLARLRGDDLVYAGSLAAGQLDQLLYAATSVAQTYSERYETYLKTAPAEPEPASALPEIDTADLLLSLMSDRDRLSELAKGAGQLRYAVEGGDRAGVADAVQVMERVGRHLAPKYRVDALIAAAREPGLRGQRLADLYLQRAYKLVAEEFDALPAIEAAIAAEQGEGAEPAP